MESTKQNTCKTSPKCSIGKSWSSICKKMNSNAKLRQIIRKKLHSRQHKQRRRPRLHLEARSRWTQGENKSGLAVRSRRGPRDFWRPRGGLRRLPKKHLRKTFEHPDVRQRGCTRIEVSHCGCMALSAEKGEELVAATLQEVCVEEATTAEKGLFVVQPPASRPLLSSRTL